MDDVGRGTNSCDLASHGDCGQRPVELQRWHARPLGAHVPADGQRGRIAADLHATAPQLSSTMLFWPYVVVVPRLRTSATLAPLLKSGVPARHPEARWPVEADAVGLNPSRPHLAFGRKVHLSGGSHVVQQ